MHSPGRSNHAITYLKFFEDQIGASFSFSTNRVSFIVMKNNAYTTNIKETWRWKISVVCQTVKMSAPLLQSLCWLEPSYDVYISLLHATHLRYIHIFKHSLLVPDFLFSNSVMFLVWYGTDAIKLSQPNPMLASQLRATKVIVYHVLSSCSQLTWSDML